MTDFPMLEQISVDQFYQVIQNDHNVFLLDVRNKDEYDTWKIESRFTPNTVNVPYFEFFENEEEAMEKVPKDGRPIVIVCAKGGASDFIAARLEEEGIKAANLIEGMIGWGNHYVFRPIVETDDYQIYQVDRPSRGCLSYVLVTNGEAVIIDPLRHTEKYQDFLQAKNARISLLLDTHAHADHISGGPSLSKETGAPYYMHPYDGIHPFDMLPAKIEYEMLSNGQSFTIGNFDIGVIHTPGHTLGQVNFLVKASDGRSFLCTGDNIFIQSFGRPDLGGQGKAWAPVVYETIFNVIKKSVPGDALVLPGHYARHTEANSEGLFAQTIDDLWLQNNDLQVADREQFIDFVLNHLPTLPEQYIEIKRVNAGLSCPNEETASELELGKNICALSTAY